MVPVSAAGLVKGLSDIISEHLTFQKSDTLSFSELKTPKCLDYSMIVVETEQHTQTHRMETVFHSACPVFSVFCLSTFSTHGGTLQDQTEQRESMIRVCVHARARVCERKTAQFLRRPQEGTRFSRD